MMSQTRTMVGRVIGSSKVQQFIITAIPTRDSNPPMTHKTSASSAFLTSHVYLARHTFMCKPPFALTRPVTPSGMSADKILFP